MSFPGQKHCDAAQPMGCRFGNFSVPEDARVRDSAVVRDEYKMILPQRAYDTPPMIRGGKHGKGL